MHFGEMPSGSLYLWLSFCPTRTWNNPGETLVSHPFTLTVRADVPPEQYRLITGFYRRDTWERLTAPNGDDLQLVTTVTVIH